MGAVGGRARSRIKGVASDDDVRAAEARRRARASWPIARYRLGEEPSDDLSEVTTPAERIAMMWPLAEAAWRLAGRALPSYDRANLPGQLWRPGERPLHDDDP
jgi:hypothetical protein